MITISETARVASSATICDGVTIGENVVIEDGVFLDFGCIVRDHVQIGENSRIGARCILGEYLYEFYHDLRNRPHPLVIGKNALIRSETIIYGDCVIGDSFQTGHRVTIRENSRIGNAVRIGTLSDVQGFCEIGNYVNLHSNVHISQASSIHDFVWIFPYVVLTNDPLPPSMITKGVEIESFAVLATGSIILPGVHIGQDVLIGAGSVVTKSIPEGMSAFGNPARIHGAVREIIDPETGRSAYPWRFNFDRGMPWQSIGYDRWERQSF